MGLSEVQKLRNEQKVCLYVINNKITKAQKSVVDIRAVIKQYIDNDNLDRLQTICDATDPNILACYWELESIIGLAREQLEKLKEINNE